MNNNALADLKPLIAPPPIPWWPPAPGWWVLAIILLLSLLTLGVWCWKRWRHHAGTRYQREALELLNAVEEHDPEKQLQDTAAILRRAAICVWGREKVSTQTWSNIINQSQQENKKLLPVFDKNSVQLLTEHLYRQGTPSTEEMKNLHTQAKLWIKTLPPVEN